MLSSQTQYISFINSIEIKDQSFENERISRKWYSFKATNWIKFNILTLAIFNITDILCCIDWNSGCIKDSVFDGYLCCSYHCIIDLNCPSYYCHLMHPFYIIFLFIFMDIKTYFHLFSDFYDLKRFYWISKGNLSTF